MEPIDFYTDEELSIAKEIVFIQYIGGRPASARGSARRQPQTVFTQYIDNSARYRSATPTGILLGGQPAAGKMGLIEQIIRQRNDVKFVVINGDEYCKYHPQFRAINEEYGRDASKYTQSFSNALVDYLKAECLRLRCNFIIEGTMRTFEVIERTALDIKKAGFRCEAHVLAISRDDSLLGVFQRYEVDKQRTGAGRFSPIQVHDEAYRQIPHNLAKADKQKLFDRIVVCTRRPDGQLSIGLDRISNTLEPIDFLAEFDRLRAPVFGPSFYHQQWLALRELAQRRGESDADFLMQLDEFVALFSP